MSSATLIMPLVELCNTDFLSAFHQSRIELNHEEKSTGNKFIGRCLPTGTGSELSQRLFQEPIEHTDATGC